MEWRHKHGLLLQLLATELPYRLTECQTWMLMFRQLQNELSSLVLQAAQRQERSVTVSLNDR